MTQDRPWLANYPAGVPAEIDPEEYRSVPAVLEEAITRFRDRPAFSNMGRTITYAELDARSLGFAQYLLGELKLKKGDRVALMGIGSGLNCTMAEVEW